MSKILLLQQKVATALALAKELKETADKESREMSPEELGKLNEFMRQHDAAKANLEAEQRLADATAAAAAPAERKSEPVKPSVNAAISMARISFPQSASNLRAFRPRDGETRRDCMERAYRAGQWMRAAIWKNEPARQWCAEHGVEMRAAIEGDNVYGGALVPEEFNSAIIDLRDTYGVFRRYSRVVPMARDTMIVPRRTGGLTVYLVGENAGITASTKTWDYVTLSAKKWGVMQQMSSEVNEDAIISLADDTAQEMAWAFSQKEDDCGFNGTGANATYGGITGVLPKIIEASYTASVYTAVGTGANTVDVFGEMTATELAGCMAKLPAYALARNPKWYCPVAGKALMFDRLANALSGNSKQDAAAANVQTYCGYEIVPVPAWAGTATTDFSGLPMVLFGCLDLAATIGERRGTTIRMSTDRYIEQDMLAIVGTTRWDLVVHELGSTTVAGPIVALVGN